MIAKSRNALLMHGGKEQISVLWDLSLLTVIYRQRLANSSTSVLIPLSEQKVDCKVTISVMET